VAHWERLMPGQATSISVASTALMQACQALVADRIPVVAAPVGADLQLFQPCLDDEQRKREKSAQFSGLPGTVPVLIYTGQLEVANYPELALQALVEIVSRVGAHLWIVGDGSRRAQLEQLTASLGLQAHVHFTGYLPRDRVARMLRCADLGLAPFADTQVMRCKSPLKIAEYLAAGLPVVVSDVGEAARMVGPAGSCVPVAHGAQGFARAIVSLLASGQRSQLGQLARQRAEQDYTWEASTMRILDLWQSMLDARQTVPHLSPPGPPE
jgi:glycosyltransferase involved in cell wall biosynthesis